jgi:Ca-activated chloride channel family protein
VAFSDEGLVVQRPTDDHVEITAAIKRLMPQTGTSLGHGILAALEDDFPVLESDQSRDGQMETMPEVSIGAFAPRVIVLLTDGEDTTRSDPLEAAQMAIEQGVRVYTVGIGGAGGTTLEIDGFNVFTRLDENVLKDIAQLTEAEYYNAEDSDDLRSVYQNLDPKFVVRPEKMEITSILGGISMLVLLLGGAISLLWFGRIP